MQEQGQLTTLTFCLRIERQDGAGLAVTNHDKEVLAAGTRYEPSPLFTPGAVTRSAKLGGSTTEFEGAFESSALSADDLSSGRWDGAETRLTAVSWPSGGDEVLLTRGQLASTVLSERGFSAELTGADFALEAAPCPMTSPDCRAIFGGKQCRVDLAGRRKRAKVVEADGELLWLDQRLGHEFVFGSLRWFSGANTGLTGTILRIDGDCIHLRERPRLPVQVADWLVVTEGCDKRLQTCAERFGNAANFRGEPHLPGNDFILRYPGA